MGSEIRQLRSAEIRQLEAIEAGERPPALSPSYGIANGRHGFFHSFGFDDPAAATGDWSNHPRHFNNGDAVEVPSPDFINVKFLFDKPKGENLDVSGAS